MIVDDEDSALDALEDELNEIDAVRIVGKFTSPMEALQQVGSLHVDMVFLDIEMPGIDGLALADQMLQNDQSVDVVFTTAYDQYAVEAFEVNALDYILKPVMQERLLKSFNKWMAKHKSTDSFHREPACRIATLGTFQLMITTEKETEQTVKWRTNKARELFAYFVHQRGQDVHKSDMIIDIWPEYDRERAIAHLHTGVYYIRKMIKQYRLEHCMTVYYANDYYRFDMQGVSLDMDNLVCIASMRECIQHDNIEQYEQAAALYCGPYMGNHDYPWSVIERQKLELDYLELVSKLSEYYESTQRYQDAIELLQRGLEHNPWQEELHELLMDIYNITGNHTAREEHYRRMKEMFREELGIEPKVSAQSEC